MKEVKKFQYSLLIAHCVFLIVIKEPVWR